MKAHYWLQAWSSCFGMKLNSFKRNCFFWHIFESSVGSYAENLAEKCSDWVFLVWFIFLRRLGWHSSCPFPPQNHWKPHHLIATLPFGTQTFNLFTLNAPSSASVPLPPARSNPTQEKLKNVINFKKWSWVMHWDKTKVTAFDFKRVKSRQNAELWHF